MDRHYKEAWEELTAKGAAFSWSNIEISNNMTRVYDSAPANLVDIWSMSAAHGEKDYLIYGDERISYEEAHLKVNSFASYLHNLGIKHGDRVAILMRNYPEWVLTYWAIASLGAVAVGMNAWWTGPEIEFAVDDCDPRVIVCDQERMERIIPHLSLLRGEGDVHLVAVRTGVDLPEDSIRWEDAISIGKELPNVSGVPIEPDDDVCVFYTSGTTGHPKGAVLTHRGAVSNLLNLAFWSTMAKLAEQKAVEAGEPPTGSDKKVGESNPGSVLAVPLFHVTGCNCCMHPVTAVGGKLVLMHKWNPEQALEVIERERPTTFTGVPTMARELVNSPDFSKRDTSSLDSLGGGGAAVQPDLVQKIEERLEGRPSTGYGLTEVNGVITVNAAHFFLAKPESAGSPCPVMESRIVDGNGEDLPIGEEGELWVKGGNVFRGYLNRPEANKEVLTEGWFHTGDIAYFDEDGFLFLVDRAKDMVLRGGENVYSAEVEAAIYKHPSIAEAAVFAVPDERLGETVGVAIYLLPETTCSIQELKDHVSSLIAPFKVPEHIWFVDEALPRNANGKFLKRELKERFVGS
ncbi:MAG: acyl--CoA ligase [Acidimicrobiales bacterium]|nr:acyl--CoA ligase [Acidimicrobiales bacterium]